jgi:hypothetical protein
VRSIGTWVVAALMLTWWVLLLGLGVAALIGGPRSM